MMTYGELLKWLQSENDKHPERMAQHVVVVISRVIVVHITHAALIDSRHAEQLDLGKHQLLLYGNNE